MKTVAYVDHSYHRLTKSNYDVLAALLEQDSYIVTYFWDESWDGGKSIDFHTIQHFDVIIMFQCVCNTTAQSFSQLHNNVIFVPMLDQIALHINPEPNLAQFFKLFKGSRVLNFSSEMHTRTLEYGIQSKYIKYWQPTKKEIIVPHDGLHGFFWLRHEEHVSWKTIRNIIGDTCFSSLHIHLAHDPNSPAPTLPSKSDYSKFNITTSSWYDNKRDLEEQLNKANIYFAPRLAEGIGQSFLEAMARGQCVIAANQGTMNEYIVNGNTGLLYNWKEPRAMDFKNAIQIGHNAHDASYLGHLIWLEQTKELLKWIEQPCKERLHSAEISSNQEHEIETKDNACFNCSTINTINEMQSANMQLNSIENKLQALVKHYNIKTHSCNNFKKKPTKLSIITICYNEKYIMDTCESIVQQTFQDFEWIVIDGGSEPYYLEILHKYKHRMDSFISEPDNGRYDAMNKGITRAHGEYLFFLNGGDYLHNCRVLSDIFNYTSIPAIPPPDFTCDILYGEVISRETRMMPFPLWAVGPQCFNSIFFQRHSLPHQATFIKNNLFKTIGLYDTQYTSAGDFEWWIRAILVNNASYAYLPTVVSVYNFEGLSTQNEHDSTQECDSIRARYKEYFS